MVFESGVFLVPKVAAAKTIQKVEQKYLKLRLDCIVFSAVLLSSFEFGGISRGLFNPQYFWSQNVQFQNYTTSAAKRKPKPVPRGAPLARSRRATGTLPHSQAGSAKPIRAPTIGARTG